VTAALGVVVLVVLSVWRKQLRVIYEAWRISHAALAVLACGLAMWHIFGVRYYLDLPVQRVFWIAWAVVWTAIVLYVRVVKPWLQLRHPYRVVEMIPEHGAAWTLVVEPVGHEGMTFRAGQVAWLNVQRSPFGFEQHPFSFSSSAEHPERLSFTIKELGDFTSTVSQIPVGTEVSIDGPYGTFGVECGGGQGYVLVAGGIGSAPMMSMLRTIADRGERCSIYFFYGNRTWDDVIFREELAALEERISLHVNHVLEIPPEGWTGDTGYVTQDLLDRRLPENRAELMYMISGPLIMIELVEKYLVGLGIPRRNIHSERYEMA